MFSPEKILSVEFSERKLFNQSVKCYQTLHIEIELKNHPVICNRTNHDIIIVHFPTTRLTILQNEFSPFRTYMHEMFHSQFAIRKQTSVKLINLYNGSSRFFKLTTPHSHRCACRRISVK